MKKIKRRLTEDQEFEFFKIVVDKFLLTSVLLIVSGLTLLALPETSTKIATLIFTGGIVILILFLWLVLNHYEVIWK